MTRTLTLTIPGQHPTNMQTMCRQHNAEKGARIDG